MESEHFTVHFQEGNDRSAQVVSRIAEEIYGPITELYEHEPDEKVSIVLKDREDYSNGAAYFLTTKSIFGFLPWMLPYVVRTTGCVM